MNLQKCSHNISGLGQSCDTSRYQRIVKQRARNRIVRKYKISKIRSRKKYDGKKYLKEPGNMSSVRIGRGRGRGTIHSKILPDKCLCYRPHCFVLCNVCGFWTRGRVRYFCPVHPQTVFLFDITQCPRCKSYGHMLSEY